MASVTVEGSADNGLELANSNGNVSFQSEVLDN